MSGKHLFYSGRFVVLQGPSGSGKNSIIARVRKLHPGLQTTVSSTTRAPRPGEIDGEDYHFIDRATFEQQIESGQFAEYASYGDELYGTHRLEIEPSLGGGRVLIGDLEIEGVRQLIERYGSVVIVYVQLVAGVAASGIEAELAALEERLRRRDPQMPEAKLVLRLAAARRERSLMDEEPYNFWRECRIVNYDLETAVGELNQKIILPCLHLLA